MAYTAQIRKQSRLRFGTHSLLPPIGLPFVLLNLYELYTRTHRHSVKVHTLNASGLTKNRPKPSVAIAMSDSRSLAEVGSITSGASWPTFGTQQPTTTSYGNYHIIDNPTHVEDKKVLQERNPDRYQCFVFTQNFEGGSVPRF